jgi:predicted enzyme related to lactoylglutathione lyase
MDGLKLSWPRWIGVVAENLGTLQAFYRDVLGLAVSEEGSGYVQFEMGSDHLFEVIARDPSVPQYREHGYSVAFMVEDIRGAARELEARGAERVSDIDGGPESGQYWCYFRDPEGNRFEIAQRLP